MKPPSLWRATQPVETGAATRPPHHRRPVWHRRWSVAHLTTVLLGVGWVGAAAPAAEAVRAIVDGLNRYAPPGAESFPEMRPGWDAAPPDIDRPKDGATAAAFAAAERNGRQAAEAFFRANRYLHGWLAQADRRSGLIPRNLLRSTDVWNAPDAAADNYPFMVLTALLTEPTLLAERLAPMLQAEIRLTSRVDRLPDDYSFKRQGFVHDRPTLGRVIFGASEYAKDGLMPLTEWMGPSPWRDRMLGLVEDIWKHAAIPTPFGPIPSESPEVNGELLQLLTRIHWMTGDEKFLDWAVRLGDYYLLGKHHPFRDFEELKLRDHGSEVVGGLSELYVTVHHRRPEKKRSYRAPVYELLDGVLALGRNPDGMLYDKIQPRAGTHAPRIADTWGYVYNAFLTVALVDGHAPYRDAVRKVLGSLDRYRNVDWESGSADGIADAVEGALNLYNREPVAGVPDWIDAEMSRMWAKQHRDGIIEGWHGDGNFARTSLMYALWKSQGVTVDPWRPDLRVGAVREGENLHLYLTAQRNWTGRVRFDRPRHAEFLRLPFDYPRINQFPEWFVVRRERRYSSQPHDGAPATSYPAAEMWDGIGLSLNAGRVVRWTIAPE